MRLSYLACGEENTHRVELKRPSGRKTLIDILWRMLPRNGGRSLFLLCPYCNKARRFAYGWEWDSFSRRHNVSQGNWLVP